MDCSGVSEPLLQASVADEISPFRQWLEGGRIKHKGPPYIEYITLYL